jgi:phage-related protein
MQGEIRTPPFGKAARIEAGFLLRRLQGGESLGMPHSRAMPAIGAGCHELRIHDRSMQWRIVYRVDSDAVVIFAVFRKTTQQMPRHLIETCKRRIRDHDAKHRRPSQ